MRRDREKIRREEIKRSRRDTYMMRWYKDREWEEIEDANQYVKDIIKHIDYFNIRNDFENQMMIQKKTG